MAPQYSTTTPKRRNQISLGEDHHLPVSPATPAESFFFQSLQTNTVSAFELSKSIQSTGKKLLFSISSVSGKSVCTEDFHSCNESIGASESIDLNGLPEPIQESNNEDSCSSCPEQIEVDSIISSRSLALGTMSLQSTEPQEPAKEVYTVDPSQHLYGGIKNVWGFSTDFILTKPFAKATEAIVGKVLDMSTGCDMAFVDKEIQPKLAELDKSILNPKITEIVELVKPLVQWGEDVSRPVVEVFIPELLAKFGLDKPTIEAETSAPEPAVVASS